MVAIWKGGVPMLTHEGHRARMRERFLKDGLSDMAEHEVLELLLYAVIPRRDTNETAHELIERFGSLTGVFEAERDALLLVRGIGEGAATYLAAVGQAARRYAAAKISGEEDKGEVFDTPQKIAAYLFPRYMGVGVERVYLLLFDNALHLLDCYRVIDGSVSGVPLSMRKIAERALMKGAAAAVLAHNHPGGVAVPSGDDIRLTRELDEAFRMLEIPLLEHFVFTEHAFAPIMSSVRAGQEREYAASSLLDIYRRRKEHLHAISEDGEDREYE